jgi:hypothetical protein
VEAVVSHWTEACFRVLPLRWHVQPPVLVQPRCYYYSPLYERGIYLAEYLLLADRELATPQQRTHEGVQAAALQYWWHEHPTRVRHRLQTLRAFHLLGER